MENTNVSSKKIIINHGAILGLITVLLGVYLYYTGAYTDPHWIFGVLSTLVLIAVITYGIKAFKNVNDGYLELMEALKIGIGIALIGGLISTLWTLVLTNVIEPDYLQHVREVQHAKMIEDPKVSKELADQSFEMAEKFTSPFVSTALSIIGSLFFGFIISLISGLVMQNKKDL